MHRKWLVFFARMSGAEAGGATTILHSYSGSPEGNRVLRLVDKFVDRF